MYFIDVWFINVVKNDKFKRKREKNVIFSLFDMIIIETVFRIWAAQMKMALWTNTLCLRLLAQFATSFAAIFTKPDWKMAHVIEANVINWMFCSLSRLWATWLLIGRLWRYWPRCRWAMRTLALTATWAINRTLDLLTLSELSVCHFNYFL